MENDRRSRYSSRGPPSSHHSLRIAKKQFPQKTVDDFWDKFNTKFPGKVHTILPKNVYAKSKAAHQPKGIVHGQAALRSYEDAKRDCTAAVEKIAKECRRVNMRYRDPHFDVEFDLKQNTGTKECLEGFGFPSDDPFKPQSVKRVPEIFSDPHFYVDDATASDVRQGNDGDCWFLSALCALGNKEGLIDRICVARDEKVGVYGFVFHRDGEWIQTIIDDKLYLSVTDYDESTNEKFSWEKIFNRQDAEEEYRKAYQTGSRALYFAQCSNENETWLPLLEKAFAKAHGDYRAIYGGFTGEAIEDLTGGVTTELFTTDILDIDHFWKEEIMKVNKEFLFGCATGCFDDWQNGGRYTDRKGVVAMHAYSIMDAVEAKGERLLRVRNPWGKTEWQGAWSDGSSEWTPEWMELLGHKFGNDGIFWISYKDLLRKYQSFDRTRLFGPEWTSTQQWTTVNVPWTADYNDTKFTLTLEKKGSIVIVLSQLDDRYFQGLEGQYKFSLHFRLEKDGEDDYIVRSHGNYLMRRSVSADLELEAGSYSVLMKITAQRFSDEPTPEQTLRENCRSRQEKLLRIGLAYDLAHARGEIRESEQEKEARAERQKVKDEAARQKQREELRAAKYKQWLIGKKWHERNLRHKKRDEEHRLKKAEAKKAAAGESEEQTNVVNGGENMVVPTTNGVAVNDETTASTTNGIAIGENTVPASTNGVPAIEDTRNSTVNGIASAEDQSISANNSNRTESVQMGNLSSKLSKAAFEEPTPPISLDQLVGKDQDEPSKFDPSNQGSKFAPTAPETNGVGQDNISREDYRPYDDAPREDEARDDAPQEDYRGDDYGDKENAPPYESRRDENAPDDDNKSDTSSLRSFNSSIDDDLDLDPLPTAIQVPEPGAPPPSNNNMDDNDDPDYAEFANDPWNAVCVVGLRVFSKGSGVCVGVVRPKNGEDDVDGETPLDLDDPSKRISGREGTEEEVEGEKFCGTHFRT